MFFTTSGRCFRCTLATLIIFQFTLSHGLGIESINIDENSPTYVDISWEIEAGSSWAYYTVDAITEEGNSVTGYPTNTTDMLHRVTGLRPDTRYILTVTPWTTEVRGDSLNETVTTESIPEGEILVSDVTTSSVFIQWRPVEGVFFYTIEGEPSDAVQGIAAVFATEAALAILRPATVFNVTVKGGNPVEVLATTQIRSGELNAGGDHGYSTGPGLLDSTQTGSPQSTGELNAGGDHGYSTGPGLLDSTQTGSPQSTGGAYFPTLHYVLFFVPFLAVLLA